MEKVEVIQARDTLSIYKTAKGYEVADGGFDWDTFAQHVARRVEMMGPLDMMVAIGAWKSRNGGELKRIFERMIR